MDKKNSKEIIIELRNIYSLLWQLKFHWFKYKYYISLKDKTYWCSILLYLRIVGKKYNATCQDQLKLKSISCNDEAFIKRESWAL